jgi:hypothetical protein
VAHLPEWTKEENNLYSGNLQNMYLQVLNQYLRYIRHVAANVGSVYETFKTVEQPGDIYTSEPKAKQKAAVAFLQKEVFTAPKWLLDDNILNKISSPVRVSSLARIQTTALDLVLNDRVLNTLLKMEARFGKDSCYTLIEYLDDLQAGIWSELKTGKTVDIFRRGIQKNYVNNLFAIMKEAEEGKNVIGILLGVPEENLPITTYSDLSSYLSLYLQNLRKQILKAIPSFTDNDTKAHLTYIASEIKSKLKVSNDGSTKEGNPAE